MEEENNLSEVHNFKCSKLLLPIIVAVVVTALIIGLASAYWQSTDLDDDQDEQLLLDKIANLEEQVEALQAGTKDDETMKEDKDEAEKDEKKEDKDNVVDLIALSHNGYTLWYPDGWVFTTNSTGGTFADDSGRQIAELRCPIPITGYEGMEFQRQIAEYTKDGKTYTRNLWLGNTTPEAGGGYDTLAMIFIHRYSNNEWGASHTLDADSCQISFPDYKNRDVDLVDIDTVYQKIK